MPSTRTSRPIPCAGVSKTGAHLPVGQRPDRPGGCYAAARRGEAGGPKHSINDVEARVVHHGVACDVCGGAVRGRRFKCLTCADYDLCEACRLRGHHSVHDLLCIPTPVRSGHMPDITVLCGFCDEEISREGNHQCFEYLDAGFPGAHLSLSGIGASRQGKFDRSDIPPAATVRDACAPKSAARSKQEQVVLHDRVWCDTCGKVITGTRFKCGNCDDFDLCSTCEAKTDHGWDHVFLKIRRPLQLDSVGVLLPPLDAPDIRQRAIRSWCAWTALPAAPCPASFDWLVVPPVIDARSGAVARQESGRGGSACRSRSLTGGVADANVCPARTEGKDHPGAGDAAENAAPDDADKGEPVGAVRPAPSAEPEDEFIVISPAGDASDGRRAAAAAGGRGTPESEAGESASASKSAPAVTSPPARAEAAASARCVTLLADKRWNGQVCVTVAGEPFRGNGLVDMLVDSLGPMDDSEVPKSFA